MTRRIPVAILSLLSFGLFSVAVVAAARPAIVGIGGEENISGLGGRLPSIAVDSKDSPHIALDVSGQGKVFFWDKVNNNWQHSSYTWNGASQFYNPHIEINDADQAWISGVMWWPYGMGIIVRNSLSTAPTWGGNMTHNYANRLPVSNLSLHPSWTDMAVANWTVGDWALLHWGGGNSFTTVGSGNVGPLHGGEKHYFWVSKKKHAPGEGEVWHFCTEALYQNTIRANSGNNNLEVWADLNTYPDMGNDGCYPGMCSDNDEAETAYLAIAAQYGAGPQGIQLNVWRNNHLTFPKNALLNMDPAGSTGLRRFEPQLYPANTGGAWLCYTKGGGIYLVYIPAAVRTIADCYFYNGSGFVCNGTRGSCCVDSKGNLHIVYDYNGFKYRKIAVSGDAFIDPAAIDMSVFTPAFTSRRRQILRKGNDWVLYIPAITRRKTLK